MPRGQPDFGMYAALNYLAGLSDMAELAVRLGSIVIFDRRGKVIDLDDFELPSLGWAGVGLSPNYVRLDSTNSLSGIQSVLLNVESALGASVYISKAFMPLPSRRVGAEIAFSRPGVKTAFILTSMNSTTDATLEAIAKIDFSTRVLSIYIAGGVWEDLATLDGFSTSKFIFYPIKLVADFDTGYYVRLIVGAVEYDITSYGLYASAGSVTPITFIKYELKEVVEDGGSIYLDNHILTMDEP